MKASTKDTGFYSLFGCRVLSSSKSDSVIPHATVMKAVKWFRLSLGLRMKCVSIITVKVLLLINHSLIDCCFFISVYWFFMNGRTCRIDKKSNFYTIEQFFE